MSANVDYSDFNVLAFDDTETGAHFIWAGELYQKLKPFWSEEVEIAESRNVIRPRDGEFFCFFGDFHSFYFVLFVFEVLFLFLFLLYYQYFFLEFLPYHKVFYK